MDRPSSSSKAGREVQRQVEQSWDVGWGIQDSQIEDYSAHFKEVIPAKFKNEPGEPRLKKFIESTLADKRGSAIGVELGGMGYNLFDGFTKGFFSKTVAISLSDMRKRQPDIAGSPKLPSHKVIEGDMFSKDTQAKLETWLGGNKADLIIERMAGGHTHVPQSLAFQRIALGQWYSLLNEGGLMFVELPRNLDKGNHIFSQRYQEEHREIFEAWVEELRRAYRGALDIKYSDQILFIHKLTGAPEELPRIQNEITKER